MGIVTPSVQPLLAKARLKLRERLERRTLEDESQLMEAMGLTGESVRAAHNLLSHLGILLGVSPGKFRHDDSMKSLLIAPKEALDLDDSEQELWRRAGLQEGLAPDAYELLELLLRGSSREGWKMLHASLEPKPRNDDDWISVIERMRLDDFLRFFASAYSSFHASNPGVKPPKK